MIIKTITYIWIQFQSDYNSHSINKCPTIFFDCRAKTLFLLKTSTLSTKLYSLSPLLLKLD